MNKPLVNGEMASWVQLQADGWGRTMTGVKSISYTEEREMQDNYGAGNRPIGRSYGKIMASGSLELYHFELEGLQQAAENGDITSLLETDIVISWLPEDSTAIRQHVLKNVRIKNNGREVSEGDMEVATQLDLMVSHIVW